MSDLQGKFIWYELLTSDTVAAAKFYGSVVGWTTRDAGMAGYQIFDIPGTERGVGGMMTIPDELKEAGVPPNWTGYVYVDDVDATAKAYTENGGSVRRPPDDIPGIGRFAIVADPHGAVLAIMKPLPMDNPPPEPTMTPGYAGWHELYAGNEAEAFTFYSKIFGWTSHEKMDMGPEMGIYHIFAHNGQMTGGIMTKTPEVPMPCWGYYFIVAGIDTAVEKVNAGGGKVVNGPMEVPGSWIIQAVDPQGAYFCLTGPRG
jgi:uncharacterized protein